MRKTGLWFIGLGLAGQLFVSTFYAMANVFEIWDNDWYPNASKATGVADALSALLLLLGFIIFVASRQAATPRLGPGYQAGSALPPGGWPQAVVPNAPVRPPAAEERLARLHSLGEAGHITSAELAQQRARVLEEL